MSMCNSCNKKSTAQSNSKNTCGSLRSNLNAGSLQPTSATAVTEDKKTTDVENSRHVCGCNITLCDMLLSLGLPQPKKFEREPSTKCSASKSNQGVAEKANDMLNSRHVCGGKDSICEFLKSSSVVQSLSEKSSKSTQSTNLVEKTARDIANSKHVCGGKGSICEFLRSKPVSKPNCENTTKSKSPRPCGNVAKPDVPASSCGNATKPKSSGLCRICAKSDIPISNCENTKKLKSPGLCETASKPETAVKPIVIENTKIILNLCLCGKDKQCQFTESGLNLNDSKQKEHNQCIEPESNSSSLKQEKHHPRTETEFSCTCMKKSDNPGDKLICECFSMAEPYMLVGQTLDEHENNDDEQKLKEQQQQKKKSCLHRRRHRHSKTSISSKQTIKPVQPPLINFVSHHESQVNGAQKSKTGDPNMSSCKCWCHGH